MNKRAITLVGKMDIKMPGKRGAVIPQGTPFLWSSRTHHYVCRIQGSIVASIPESYVEKVHIFEPA